jgi:hypothetical protein
MIDEARKDKRKNAINPNSIRGTQRFTRPSRTNGDTNIQIKSDIAIPKLKKLAQDYEGINNTYGFLTDLRNALGIPNTQGASKYGEVVIPKGDGNMLKASLRITNHNSNAETYITHNANYEYNLSILVRKNYNDNNFKSHDDVILDEFVYYGKRLNKLKSPLSQIINSIIGFLEKGIYVDSTGVAFKNTSPQHRTLKTGNLNCNILPTNSSKRIVKLTECQLINIISESVKQCLNEFDTLTYLNASENSAKHALSV